MELKLCTEIVFDSMTMCPLCVNTIIPCINIIILREVKYMIQLFEIDLHDYDATDKIFSRPSARGIIFIKGKIALVYSNKEKYYKFPGGGIHNGENNRDALCRKVREEVGLVVIPESIHEFGSVLRRQKSNCLLGTIFEQENFYYYCDVKGNIVEQNLDDYEKEAEFVLRLVNIDEAIEVNSKYESDDFFNEIMIKREKRVLELIKERMTI